MQSIKFSAPLVTVFELDRLAKKRGRSRSEITLHAVERGLGGMPETEKSEAEDIVVDKMERGRKGRAVAIYMSAPIAGAIQRLAREQDRSASWITRSLLRKSLRNRGLLPSNADTPVDAALEIAN